MTSPADTIAARAATCTLQPERTLLQYPVLLWRWYLAWQMRRAMRMLLATLDDRTLRDIGVRRSEIGCIVRDIT